MNKKNLIPLTAPWTMLLILEVIDGNPNGDPDNQGAPRVDTYTGHGLINAAAITSRAHRLIGEMHNFEAPYDVQIRRGSSIEGSILKAIEDANIDLSKAQAVEDAEDDAEDDGSTKKKAKKRKTLKLSAEDKRNATKASCARYIDVRGPGSVQGVGKVPIDSVKGAITVGIGRSVYPVDLQEYSITRCAPNSPADEKEQEMGRATRVTHGVYRIPIFVNPHHAKTNGFTMEDLAVYVHAYINAYEHARSGMSGSVNVRGLWAFRHSSAYGDAPAHVLLESVQVDSEKGGSARSWSDYNLRFDTSKVPSTIKVFNLEQLLGAPEAVLKTITE